MGGSSASCELAVRAVSRGVEVDSCDKFLVCAQPVLKLFARIGQGLYINQRQVQNLVLSQISCPDNSVRWTKAVIIIRQPVLDLAI
jgi:hypothetical protein